MARIEVLAEINDLKRKAASLPLLERKEHLPFLDDVAFAFNDQAAGIWVRVPLLRSKVFRVDILWENSASYVSVRSLTPSPDQMRWLVRRAAKAGLFIGAYRHHQQVVQKIVDQAGVDLPVRVLPSRFWLNTEGAGV
jgi:hypothetical protein